MEALLAVYLLGAAIGVIYAGAGALSDNTNGDSPREVFGAMARRLVMGLLWPIASPLYVARAVARDEW